MVRTLGALSLGVAALAGCVSELCGNEVQQTILSPSGNLAAAVLTRNCGATTDFSTQVSVIPAGQSLPNEAGNTFVLAGQRALSLQWQTGALLRIRGTGPSVFKKNESRANGVEVRYGDDAR